MHQLLVPLLLLFTIACGDGISTSNEEAFPDVNLDSLEVDKTKTWIHISKSKRVLALMEDTHLLKRYPVVLGFNPTDDKLREGDGCTPEGTFKIRDLYPHRSWSKFIWIDYPNDASWEKHEAAKAGGSIPAESAIGGEVGIHGVPAGSDFLITMKEDWTLGCISLKNDDVDELYKYVQQGTTIVIEK
ncbi:MAG: L,D-transpeptidase [Bacteroidia bacterium]